MKMGLNSPPCSPLLQLLEHLVGDLLGDVRPDVDDLVVALAVGDDAVLVLLLHLVDLLARLRDELAPSTTGCACRRCRCESPDSVA